jgi:TPP-dependent pyruvate/acetoin dehydrogenase alpha subunit
VATRDAEPVTGAADAGLAVDLYRRMLLIRGFEDRVQSLFLRGEVYGTTHLYSGQEAVAVGFASVLSDGDRIACTYRGHGHLLAMGTDPTGLLAELLGRATGVNGGLAGSMNVVDPDHGVIGCYGIVGGSIAAATGAALALRGSGRVAVAYFGDGAANQAYFFECLNLAKVLALPAVFVCENNQYGEYTPTAAVTPGGILPRAEAMEVSTSSVDGMDVWAVRRLAGEVVGRVRDGGGPELVEAATYRFVGHSRSDPGRYRPEGELERWQERDPLVVAAARLRAEHGLGEDEIAAVEAEVERSLGEIERTALAAPFPAPKERREFAGGTGGAA